MADCIATRPYGLIHGIDFRMRRPLCAYMYTAHKICPMCSTEVVPSAIRRLGEEEALQTMKRRCVCIYSVMRASKL